MASGLLPYLSFLLALGAVIDCPAQIFLNHRISNAGDLVVAFPDNRVSRNPGRLLRVSAQETGTLESLWPKAKAAMDQGNFAEARRLLRQAVQENPNDGALWFHLGVSCAELNEFDEAIAALERARALAPRQADTYFDLGLVYWRKGNVNKAIEFYRAGLALRPKETTALQNYSLLLMKTENYKAAIAPLQNLKSDPQLGISPRVALIECLSLIHI